MFLGFKKKDEQMVLAPLSGKAVPITEVPDPVFADKILGDGVAVIPTSSTVVSPAAGKVINVADTYHAYGIETKDGLELLIHVGINTVELKGKGFNNHVSVGDSVKAGTPLCDVDWDVIKQAGYETYTPVLVTNMEVIKSLTVETGDCEAGQTCVIRYEK